MNRVLFLLIFLFSFPSFAQNGKRTNGANKKADTYKWYKGNTHAHSYWSDGDDFPEMIMDWYKSHGYDFICLSDHNVLAEGEKWKMIPKSQSHNKRFEEYLKKYGRSWVIYKKDSADRISVKLKRLEEYRPLFEEPGKFLIIQAEEITDHYEDKPVHMNAVNLKELIPPQGGNSVREVMQNNLDKVYEQRTATGQPMFPHLNHPNFGWAVTVEDMEQLTGERFFEVYNGHPSVHNYGDILRPGTEKMWDRLLVHYIENGKPLLYGLATDDAHHYLNYKVGQSNPGRGHIMVRAKELTPAALIEAMEQGDFYSTTGVVLDEITFVDNVLTVKVKQERGVNYTIQFFGARKSEGTEPDLLNEVKGTHGQYKMSKDDLYVRAKIISSKKKENPYKDGDMETAWTQPVVGDR